MWPRRLQQPHPPIFVPSQGSSETIEWAAEHRYPYVCTYIPMPQLIDYHDEYRRFAEERFGYTAGPEQFGWTSLIYVAETEQEAIDAVAPHPSTSPSDASRCRPRCSCRPAARPRDRSDACSRLAASADRRRRPTSTPARSSSAPRTRSASGSSTTWSAVVPGSSWACSRSATCRMPRSCSSMELFADKVLPHLPRDAAGATVG